MDQSTILTKLESILRENELCSKKLELSFDLRADLELDSLGLLTLSSEIEDEFDIVLSQLSTVSSITTVQELVTVISAQLD